MISSSIETWRKLCLTEARTTLPARNLGRGRRDTSPTRRGQALVVRTARSSRTSGRDGRRGVFRSPCADDGGRHIPLRTVQVCVSWAWPADPNLRARKLLQRRRALWGALRNIYGGVEKAPQGEATARLEAASVANFDDAREDSVSTSGMSWATGSPNYLSLFAGKYHGRDGRRLQR